LVAKLRGDRSGVTYASRFSGSGDDKGTALAVVGFVNFALLDLPSVFGTSLVVDNARIIVSRNSTGGERALAAVSLIPLPEGVITKVLGPVARLRPVVLTADGIRALGATLRSQLGRWTCPHDC